MSGSHRIHAFFDSLKYRQVLPISHTYMALNRILQVVDDIDLKLDALNQLATKLNFTSSAAMVEYVHQDPWYIAEMQRLSDPEDTSESQPLPTREQAQVGPPRPSDPAGGWLPAAPIHMGDHKLRLLSRRQARKEEKARRKAEHQIIAKEKAERRAFGIARARKEEDEMLARNMQPWCPIEKDGTPRPLRPQVLAFLLKNRGYEGPIRDVAYPWRQIYACMLHGIPLYYHWLNAEDKALLARTPRLSNNYSELRIHVDQSNALIRRCYETLLKEHSEQPEETVEPMEVQQDSYSFPTDDEVPTQEIRDPVLEALAAHNHPTCPGGIERTVVRRKRIVLQPTSTD